MKPTDVTTHEHYFVTDDDQENGTEKRYDAYETANDECGVWSPMTNQHWETKSYAEARRMARALAAEYAALAAKAYKPFA